MSRATSDAADAASDADRPPRQTLFFSATWPKEVQAVARALCRNDPIRVFVGGAQQKLVANKDITQRVQVCAARRGAAGGGPRAPRGALRGGLWLLAAATPRCAARTLSQPALPPSRPPALPPSPRSWTTSPTSCPLSGSTWRRRCVCVEGGKRAAGQGGSVSLQRCPRRPGPFCSLPSSCLLPNPLASCPAPRSRGTTARA
jgi:hypothetical protein